MTEHLRTARARDALIMARRATRGAPGVTCAMRQSARAATTRGPGGGFAMPQAEIAATRCWPARAAARRAICAWRERRYHHQRRHPALADQPPVTAEALVVHEQAA